MSALRAFKCSICAHQFCGFGFPDFSLATGLLFQISFQWAAVAFNSLTRAYLDLDVPLVQIIRISCLFIFPSAPVVYARDLIRGFVSLLQAVPLLS